MSTTTIQLGFTLSISTDAAPDPVALREILESLFPLQLHAAIEPTCSPHKAPSLQKAFKRSEERKALTKGDWRQIDLWRFDGTGITPNEATIPRRTSEGQLARQQSCFLRERELENHRKATNRVPPRRRLEHFLRQDQGSN